MEQRALHTYALPSSRRSSISSDTHTSLSIASEPPSPGRFASPVTRGRGILLPPMQYGPPTPIEQNKPLEDSTTPFRQKETPVDLWRHMNSDHLGYRASEWALLGVERRDVRSKYIFTLLHWPTLTMFAWPLDAKDPKMQGACFLTQIDKDASGTDVSGLVRVSLRVLEEVVRAWLRYVRSNPSLRHGRIFAEDADILAICQALFLSPASAAHRHEWLQQQRIPDVPSSLPPSRPSSPDRSSARRTASPKSTALSGMPSHLHS